MVLLRWKFAARGILALSVLLLALTGCNLAGEPGPLDPRGSVADDQYRLIVLGFGIMFFVLIVVFALFFYAIIRYRKRKGQTGLPRQVEGNHKLEVIWTVIPIILLLIFAVPTVYMTFAQAKDLSDDPEALKIKATSYQFWWQFEYPDYGIVTAQELYIPVGKKIYAELNAADVMHSFWIPALAGKMDMLPGLTNYMYFDAKEEGIYKGKCAELCGRSHALMDFKVIAVSEAEFEAWVQEMTNPPAETETVVTEGQQIFKDNCLACHATSPDGRSLGPNLNNFANRMYVGGYLENTAEWIEQWIAYPQGVKPGATMPAFGEEYAEMDDEDGPGFTNKNRFLTEEQIKAVTEYLLSLDNKR